MRFFLEKASARQHERLGPEWKQLVDRGLFVNPEDARPYKNAEYIRKVLREAGAELEYRDTPEREIRVAWN